MAHDRPRTTCLFTCQSQRSTLLLVGFAIEDSVELSLSGVVIVTIIIIISTILSLYDDDTSDNHWNGIVSVDKRGEKEGEEQLNGAAAVGSIIMTRNINNCDCCSDRGNATYLRERTDQLAE